VDLKKDYIQLLEKELEAVQPRRVLIGAVTDPYQPLERRYRYTRQTLELLIRYRLPAIILTKSVLIGEDIEWLKELSAVKVCFTVNDPWVINNMETGSDPLNERRDMIGELNDQGVYTYAHVGPYFPGITQFKTFFQILSRRCPRINFESINLKMLIERDTIMGLIGRDYPHLIHRYQTIMESASAYCDYWADLQAEIESFAQSRSFKVSVLFRPFNQYYKNDGERNVHASPLAPSSMGGNRSE